MERTQNGTMVHRRTILQVCEQWLLLFPLGVPSAGRMVASVAPMIAGWGRKDQKPLLTEGQAVVRESTIKTRAGGSSCWIREIDLRGRGRSKKKDN